MKCSKCERSPEFACLCKYIPFCPDHVGPHLIELGDHFSERLNISLDNPEFKFLKTEIISRIKDLEASKSAILNLSMNLIQKIQNLSRTAIEKLDSFSQLYSTLITFKKISKSLENEARKIQSTKLVITVVSADISDTIKDAFNQSLFNFIDRVQEENKITEGEEKKRNDELKRKKIEKKNKNLEEEKKRKELIEIKKLEEDKKNKEFEEKKRNQEIERKRFEQENKKKLEIEKKKNELLKCKKLEEEKRKEAEEKIKKDETERKKVEQEKLMKEENNKRKQEEDVKQGETKVIVQKEEEEIQKKAEELKHERKELNNKCEFIEEKIKVQVENKLISGDESNNWKLIRKKDYLKSFGFFGNETKEIRFSKNGKLAFECKIYIGKYK